MGHALDGAGYECLPAQNARSATELLALEGIALEAVVIEADLPDAASFVVLLRRMFPGIKVVAAVAEESLADLSVYDAHRRKPQLRHTAAVSAWVSFIQEVSPPGAARGSSR